MQADRYSRMVALLKVVLPIAALALLSTLFLLSRSTDPASAIPFADKEIQDRLQNQQVTGPFFSGTTTKGDQISFSADTLTTPDGSVGANEARGVKVQMDLIEGGKITVESENARFDIVANLATLSGGARLTTSEGYRIAADKITAKLSELYIEATGNIIADSPNGQLTAENLTLSSTTKDGPLQLVFKNRVKLIYQPKQRQE